MPALQDLQLIAAITELPYKWYFELGTSIINTRFSYINTLP